MINRHDNDRNMQREWRTIIEMPESTTDSPIRQVYVWILTRDDKVVIVSKDDATWQLPGGKPNVGEDAVQTAVREVYEETGIDLQGKEKDINFFGEYTIDDSSLDAPDVYRQVRAWIRLPQTAAELTLTTKCESDGQRLEDTIRFVEAVLVSEVQTRMPWLPMSDEYKTLHRNNVI